jgi:hypothetical protein
MIIWIIAVFIIAYIIIRFSMALNKDKSELKDQALDQKFKGMVTMINQYAFNGEGTVFYLDKREFNLYRENANQIVKFQYSTGQLTITWKYKYYHQEVVLQKDFNNARNMSLAEQERLASRVIDEMKTIVKNHQQKVKPPTR